jgi:hypothetical protein
MNWVNKTNKKIQAFHWNPLAEINDLEFMSGGGATETTDCIDFIELSGGRRLATKIKLHMNTLYDDGSDRVSVYNVWFADSPQALTHSIANDPPTEIICSSWPFGLPVIMTFDVTTRYMAINYDSSKSNHNPSLTSISIYAY